MHTFDAAIFRGPNRPLVVRELTLPDPGPGEVLVKLAASGVCHSDLHVLTGDWTVPAPLVLGHEGAGVVVGVGADVQGLTEGDHAILSWISSCRRCDYCVSGRPVLCEFARSTSSAHVAADGRPRLRLDGAAAYSYLGLGTFGEYVLVPEQAAIRIRDDAPLAQAALVGCAVATGIGAVVNTARVEAGSSVLVIGCGGVGLNAIQGAQLAGARQIIASDISDEKLELARSFGATHTVNSAREDLVSAVHDLTSGGADYAFEVIGLAPTIRAAFDAVRRGGTAVVVGQAATGIEAPINALEISMYEKRLIGSNYGSIRQQIDFPRIVDLYMEGRIDLDSMITDRIRLADVNLAFERMSQGRGIRSVIEY